MTSSELGLDVGLRGFGCEDLDVENRRDLKLEGAGLEDGADVGGFGRITLEDGAVAAELDGIVAVTAGYDDDAELTGELTDFAVNGLVIAGEDVGGVEIEGIEAGELSLVLRMSQVVRRAEGVGGDLEAVVGVRQVEELVEGDEMRGFDVVVEGLANGENGLPLACQDHMAALGDVDFEAHEDFDAVDEVVAVVVSEGALHFFVHGVVVGGVEVLGEDDGVEAALARCVDHAEEVGFFVLVLLG